jgi:hypothetical protein
LSNAIWIASYPKSGNTWLRALLSSYLATETEFDFNNLLGSSLAENRHLFDEILGVPSSELSNKDIDLLKPTFLQLLSEQVPERTFIKTHHKFQYSASGAPYFSRKSARCAIYLVRDPTDVAVSYAAFIGETTANIVQRMGQTDAVIDRTTSGISSTMPCPLGDWGGHVAGWMDQTEVPVLAIKYEDLLADTETTFGRILDFAGIENDPGRVRNSAEECSFARLAAQEQEHGFTAIPVSKDVFFRKGTSGDGRRTLDHRQVERIERDQRETMTRLGYLS